MGGRVVLHSDLNNCYASIECMLHPELRGKFIAVCGSTEDRHGIVLAKNQLAKQCGVKTGEVIWEARQKCPQLTIVPPHMDQYLKFSRIVRAIYLRYSPEVESFGIDESWIELTGSPLLAHKTPAEIPDGSVLRRSGCLSDSCDLPYHLRRDRMNYYIGDLHLFNRNQTDEGRNYDGRPFATVEEMNQYILERWNAKINNGDTVYILGDMAMRGKNNALLALVAQLKGKKILFRGNHDDLSDYRYQRLFEEITDYREIADSFDGKTYKLCLMHYPILMWNGQHRGSILLYAHTHNTVEEAFFQKCVKELNENKKLNVQQGKPIRAINVGCMMPYMGYEPRTLKEILSAHE